MSKIRGQVGMSVGVLLHFFILSCLGDKQTFRHDSRIAFTCMRNGLIVIISVGEAEKQKCLHCLCLLSSESKPDLVHPI